MTEYLELEMPAETDRVNISVLNDNFEKIDSEAKAVRDELDELKSVIAELQAAVNALQGE